MSFKSAKCVEWGNGGKEEERRVREEEEKIYLNKKGNAKIALPQIFILIIKHRTYLTNLRLQLLLALR